MVLRLLGIKREEVEDEEGEEEIKGDKRRKTGTIKTGKKRKAPKKKKTLHNEMSRHL